MKKLYLIAIAISLSIGSIKFISASNINYDAQEASMDNAGVLKTQSYKNGILNKIIRVYPQPCPIFKLENEFADDGKTKTKETNTYSLNHELDTVEFEYNSNRMKETEKFRDGYTWQLVFCR